MFSKLLLTVVLCILVTSCAGQLAGPISDNPPDPPSPPKPVITAAQVFSNIAETWTFQDGGGCTAKIDVRPQSDGSTIWHYTKNMTFCYWAPGAQDAELYFNLSKDPSGAWYSTGGHVLFPLGCPWCSGPLDFFYSVTQDNGKQRGYLIIPSSSTNPDLVTTVSGGTYWETDTGVEWVDTPVFSGWALVSYQREGKCIREKWLLAPGKELVKVIPIDIGDCKGLPSSLTLLRTN